jgi:hypothetical protein
VPEIDEESMNGTVAGLISLRAKYWRGATGTAIRVFP